MCFVFTCGEQEFSSYLKGYEGVTCQCHNCGNWSAKVKKRWNWFTFCFIPVLPLSMHAYEDIVCPICGFAQPLKNRQDVMQQSRGAGDMPLQNQQPMHNGPPTGWGGGPPGAQGRPPGKHQGMEYR